MGLARWTSASWGRSRPSTPAGRSRRVQAARAARAVVARQRSGVERAADRRAMGGGGRGQGRSGGRLAPARVIEPERAAGREQHLGHARARLRAAHRAWAARLHRFEGADRARGARASPRDRGRFVRRDARGGAGAVARGSAGGPRLREFCPPGDRPPGGPASRRWSSGWRRSSRSAAMPRSSRSSRSSATSHPLRERLRAQLMLALYRCDRQADALQAYQDARRTLVEELGIEPGERVTRARSGRYSRRTPALDRARGAHAEPTAERRRLRRP